MCIRWPLGPDDADWHCGRMLTAEFVVANDGGCLMQMGGGLHRECSRIRVRHLAEILASR